MNLICWVDSMGVIQTRSHKMLKELSVAVILTLLFSIGVGVLFVRTIIEMIEMFFNGELDNKEPLIAKKNRK